MTIEMVEGQLQLRDQVREYMDRGEALRTWNYLDFFLGTYEGSILKERSNHRGRPRSTRVPYKESSNRNGRCRVLRSADHETMPYFPGEWFPKKVGNNEPPLFEASILALLKPWESLKDLKETMETFAEAYDSFYAGASDKIKAMVENVQFYHECSDRARANQGVPSENVHDGCTNYVPEDEELLPIDNDIEGASEEQFASFVTEEDVENVLSRPFSAVEQLYAEHAVEIGMESGALTSSNFETVYRKPPVQATLQQIELFNVWDEAMKVQIELSEDVPSSSGEAIEKTSNALRRHSNRSDDAGAFPYTVFDDKEHVSEDETIALNQSQKMAYDIVISHLTSYLRKENPTQRLIIVHGQGGTGKTAILNAISKAFADLDAAHLLAKTATSGVAASLIGGQTLHSWAALPIKKPGSDKWITHPSKEIQERRKRNMGVLWLTIDEMSMLTTPLLAYLSQATGVVRTGISTVDPSIPFGGLNVILLGDFHQLPPVACTKRELYNSSPPDDPSRLGRTYYEQFNTVIKLEQQMRIVDLIWDAILQRARTGDCTKADILVLNRMVLTNPECDVPDFDTQPWIDVVLVTPRNGSRIYWNEKKLEQHCRRTGHTHYVLLARDTINHAPLSLQQRLVVASLKATDTNHLPNKVDLAVGMPAMVLMNIDTDSDLANGSRGTIMDIFLDPREDVGETVSGKVHLSYPPAAILFKPLFGHNKRLRGLPAGIIPIFPSRRSFSLKGASQKVVIDREQYSLTPAYAFTDYKAQGQTMNSVIVDLAKPLTGSLTPFNAYVSLSRGRGQFSIRLLRNFEEKLFTTHPSEQLRMEDDRLSDLARSTLIRFQQGELSHTEDGMAL